MVNSAPVDCREILSACNCKNFLSAPISSTLKVLVGYSDIYLKLVDANNYLQTVNTFWKNFFSEVIDEVVDVEQSHLKNLTETLAGILGDKSLDKANMNFESLTLESYEASGRRYAFVRYIPVEEILSWQRAQAERLLNSPPQTQNDNAGELQKLQKAVESKTKTLASYKRELDALKKFGGQLESLLEINP